MSEVVKYRRCEPKNKDIDFEALTNCDTCLNAA
jgi:hypothetical protein